MKRPIRILLADAQPLFRRAIAELIDVQPDLSVAGACGTGLEAVNLARELRPDVIVSDVELPALDGLAAAELILAELPGAKVIILTESVDDEHLFGAIRLGVHGFLLKDLAPEGLYAMIRSAMRDEMPISPALIGRLLAGLRSQPGSPPTITHAQVLSQRELEIMRLVASGFSNREIGSRLTITEGTVKNHVHNSLRKLNLDNRIQAAAYLVRNGLTGTGTLDEAHDRPGLAKKLCPPAYPSADAPPRISWHTALDGRVAPLG